MDYNHLVQIDGTRALITHDAVKELMFLVHHHAPDSIDYHFTTGTIYTKTANISIPDLIASAAVAFPFTPGVSVAPIGHFTGFSCLVNRSSASSCIVDRIFQDHKVEGCYPTLFHIDITILEDVCDFFDRYGQSTINASLLALSEDLALGSLDISVCWDWGRITRMSTLKPTYIITSHEPCLGLRS